MNIDNIPDKLYKKITDKDGEKILFDLNLKKSKDAYIKLQNKYNELKEDKEKKKPFKILINILFWIFCIVSIIAAFNSYLLISLLFLVIVLIIFPYIDGQTYYAYGNPIFRYYSTKKYRDVNMHPLDIMNILELEEKMELILEISALDESYISKINIDDNNDIDFLYIDKYQIPHTIQIVSGNKFYGKNVNMRYKNLNCIFIGNNVYSLDVTLPLKYSKEYKNLVK